MNAHAPRVEPIGARPDGSHQTVHHQVEAERLVRSRRYADAIAERPDFVASARRIIDEVVASGSATLGQMLWQALLNEPLGFIRACMTADDAEGRLLRSNNPFSILVGETDPAQRSRTWRIANCAGKVE